MTVRTCASFVFWSWLAYSFFASTSCWLLIVEFMRCFSTSARLRFRSASGESARNDYKIDRHAFDAEGAISYQPSDMHLRPSPRPQRPFRTSPSSYSRVSGTTVAGSGFGFLRPGAREMNVTTLIRLINSDWISWFLQCPGIVRQH